MFSQRREERSRESGVLSRESKQKGATVIVVELPAKNSRFGLQASDSLFAAFSFFDSRLTLTTHDSRLLSFAFVFLCPYCLN